MKLQTRIILALVYATGIEVAMIIIGFLIVFFMYAGNPSQVSQGVAIIIATLIACPVGILTCKQDGIM